MPFGGFGGPSGRRVRSVERALTASALLPTVAFAALGAVTVLLVAQMGISPLGAVIGQSARDGGHAVTTPRMSISVGPPRLHRSAPAGDRETTTSGGPTGPTALTFPRHVAHTIPPTRSPETTIADAESAAFTAAVTTREVTTAAVGPQGQADTEVMVASKVMYTLLTRAAMAPAPELEDQKSLRSLKSHKSLNEDTSVESVKTSHNTEAAEASKHAKAAKHRL